MNANNILNVLKQCFETTIPTKDARTTAATHLEFVINLVFCFLGDSKTFALESMRRAMMSHLNKPISRSAFWERLSRNRLKKSLLNLIEELMLKLATSYQVNETILKQLGVTAIELVDSSSITLSANVRHVFPGTRTKASIKWHAGVNLLTGLLAWFQLTPGKAHDRTCFPDVASLKGKLVIYDLGYFDYSLLYAIEMEGGFFLSRVKTNAVLQIKEVIQGLSEKVVGKSLLGLNLSRKKEAIIEVIIEKFHQEQQLFYRVIGFWNPIENRYHWYITNLTAAAYLIYPLYRLRWQIELIFKACKNSLNANQIPSENKTIIENLLLASIAAHLSTQTIFHIGLEKLSDDMRWAISFQRVAKIAVTLAHDFIDFLLNSAQENYLSLLNKIELFATEMIDPNYKKRETSLGRLNRLLQNPNLA